MLAVTKKRIPPERFFAQKKKRFHDLLLFSRASWIEPARE